MSPTDSTPQSTSASSTEEDRSYQRWYDQDPVLMEVLELLRSFQSDVRVQAELFLEKIEGQVGKEALEEFYRVSRPEKFGNRWYDKDPVISRAVELLRVVPPDAQRQAAMRFLESVKKQGLSKAVETPNTDA
ncbi:MAG: hypothetical protein QE263_09320 [Vampirovibrionales bacterium]|nr:hypothetical protein [Vampirovibrionales bacterium]